MTEQQGDNLLVTDAMIEATFPIDEFTFTRDRAMKLCRDVVEAARTPAIDGDDVVSRLCDLHRKLLLCFTSPTGQPPPRRPRLYAPQMTDCDVILDAAVALERKRLAAIDDEGLVSAAMIEDACFAWLRTLFPANAPEAEIRSRITDNDREHIGILLRAALPIAIKAIRG